MSVEDVIERLEKSKKLFAMEKLSGSITQIDIIINELKTTKNLDTINYAFKTLQTSLLVGYNNGISHRIQLSNFYSKRFNSVTKTNAKSFAEEELDKQWAKIIIQRGKSRQVIFSLDRILKEGVTSQFKIHKDDAKHDSDRAISIAYLYLAMIDGIYGKNLKDILILDTLYKHEIPDLEKLKKMDMRRIKEYFEKVDHSECLFDGFDYHIRNAIAHSSFWYDIEQKVIHFEDRYRNPPVIKEITIDELYEMSVKLSDIDVLVFYYGEIQIINIEIKKGLGLSIS